MNLREYIGVLTKFAEEHPESLDLDCIYSRDDEGNGYCRGIMEPSLMQVDSDYHCDVECDEDDEGFAPNAVCIN